jgi:hypothetical protein
MKGIIMKCKHIVFLGVLMTTLGGFKSICADVNVQVSANFSDLNNYGEWVSNAEYGTVWRPDADPEWRPFTYGHWVYSDNEWIWDSDEPFGWIVCHYGNWLYDNNQGWVWVPGYTWSSARVSWRVTDDEVGWAPLPPEPRRGYHHNEIALQWSFVPMPFFSDIEVRNHIAIRSHPVSKRVSVHMYDGPPRIDVVRRVTRIPVVNSRISRVQVTTSDRPLIRMEVENRERPRGEVPVGPRYKRVTVQPTGRLNESGQSRVRIESRNTRPETKVKVKVRDKRDNNNDKSDDNNEEQKRVK